MTADQVREALRRRYPAGMTGSYVGQWTCLEEYDNIDLMALNAWADADVIGFEVKVSRSDMRQELLTPHKRARAINICTQFYFAVPEGLLKPEELEFKEPDDWEYEDYKRERCPGLPTFGPVPFYKGRYADRGEGRYGGGCYGRGRRNKMRGPYRMSLPLPLVVPPPSWISPPFSDSDLGNIERHTEYALEEAERGVVCPVCDGKGYLAKSRVEREAPTLWVPSDSGLVVVRDNGSTHIVKHAPKRKDAFGLLWTGGAYSNIKVARQHANKVARWASNRPDPRHLPQGRGDNLMYAEQTA